ncbi:MAG: flagellin [Alphaproteobacteria bacterium]|nr:flagellin [Alphaproteobacteria bacterium]
MALKDISLSSSAKTNLFALQSISKSLDKTENNLATGKKVSSAFDNASAFLQSQGFLDRASDLSNIKDATSTALQTLNVANNGIDAASKLVDQAKGLATAALQTQDPTQRAAYAQQFDDLRSQIDGVVKDSSLNGRNVIDGTSGNLTVNFNPDNTSSLTVANKDLTSTGLGVAASTNAFVSNTDINTALNNLNTASVTLRTTAASIGSNATVIQTRQDFTGNLINNLTSASDSLTLADPNQEAANLLAQQAQHALSITSLGISNQQQQAIVKLF